MYYIKNIDALAINALPSYENSALDNNFASPFYNCVDAWGNSFESYNCPVGKITHGRLFDLESFEIDNTIAQYNNNLTWYSDNTQGSFPGKFAVSLTTEGLYLAVRVNDDLIFQHADNAKQITDYDAISFSIDGYGNMKGDERN